MRCLLAFLFAVAFAVAGRAQERHVRVELEGGERLQGTVVAMDLATLQIRVDGQVRTVDATRIRSCRFDESPAPPAGGAAPEPAAANTEPAVPAATNEAVAEPVPAESAPAGPAAGKVTWKGPLPDPADPEAAAQAPHDRRHLSRWRERLHRLDEAYPWLQPTAPVQWLSLGLLLTILLSLMVHASVIVAGAEGASLGRSIGLAIWYLVTGLLQVAAVPGNDFTVVLMLLANPTLALFWLSGLFGLTRLGASIAFAVQLGFAVLGYGVLELVTAILGSIGAPIA